MTSKQRLQLTRISSALLSMAVSSFIIAGISNKQLLVKHSIIMGAAYISLAVISTVLNIILDVWNVKSYVNSINNSVYSMTFNIIWVLSLCMGIIFSMIFINLIDELFSIQQCAISCIPGYFCVSDECVLDDNSQITVIGIVINVCISIITSLFLVLYTALISRKIPHNG